MSWNYLTIAGCLGLLLYVVWKEIVRPNKARLPLRLAAGILGAGSLACMALPVMISKQLQTGADRTVVIITDGFNADSVKNFLHGFEQPPAVFALEPLTGVPVQFRAVSLPPDSLAAIWARYPDKQVFGYGFEKGELNNLREPFRFHPAALPAGIQSINWIRQLKPGEDLVVQGRCHNPFSSPLQIFLSGLGTRPDSTFIGAGSTGFFRLRAAPNLRGKAVFSLTVIHRKDTIEQEPIPLEVDSTGPLNVLLLASAPNFENKFLKDWLAKKGYPVTVHTAISSGKQNLLLANESKPSAERLNASRLRETDVLISDPAALASLSPQEQQSVRLQVAEGGLGLIIRADSLLPRSFYAGYFPLVQTGDSISKQLPVYLAAAVPDTGSWHAGQPLYIRPQPASQPLVQTSTPGVLASSVLYGSGKIILTTLPNSYSWLLAGSHSTYGAYWSLLLSKALRKQSSTETWSYSPALPGANEPVGLQVETDGTSPDDLISGTRVAYAQNIALPFAWQTTYWPKRGWQTAGEEKEAVDWYAYEAQDWKGIKARRKLQDTKNHLLQQVETDKKETAPPARQPLPIDKIYFFIIFILSAGFLWIEKKFR